MDSGSQSSLSQSELTMTSMTIDTGEDTTQYEMEEESESEFIQKENLYTITYMYFFMQVFYF